MSKLIRVAIDGPSGAGKSTIAKAVGKQLNLDYIDTGAMYRAVAYKMIANNVSIFEMEKLEKLLAGTEIDFSNGNIILDDEIINEKIRTPEISKMASDCSALPQVREKLVALQRKMGETKNVIMDGRDIGTNVLVDAEFKLFMTASPEERAKRRYIELNEKGEKVSFAQVLKDIKERDHNDSTRALNPLKKAEDALELDTTGMSIEEVINCVLKEIK
ncbi:MAG: (d)CMP kinase [Peptostreptococcaceae bacterium]|nr:(d)CMP kinase [Peptostreptococcaceae bacterium]